MRKLRIWWRVWRLYRVFPWQFERDSGSLRSFADNLIALDFVPPEHRKRKRGETGERQ